MKRHIITIAFLLALSVGGYAQQNVRANGDGTLLSPSNFFTANPLAPVDATFITKTPNGSLSAEFAMSTLATGLVKNTTTTGAPTIATAGTDYVAPGAYTASGLTMATARLLGRTTASTGAAQEITVGTGLSLSGGTLTATGGGGGAWGSITGTITDQTDLVSYIQGATVTALNNSGATIDYDIGGSVWNVSGDFQAPNIFGTFHGDITGNVTGNVTGNLTGNADTATTATTATTASAVPYSGVSSKPTPISSLGALTSSTGALLLTSGTASVATTISGLGITNGSVIDGWGGKTVPSGTIADLSSTQTFTNKSISYSQVNSGVPTTVAGLGITGGAKLDAAAGLSGAIVGTSDTQTLTNKSISYSQVNSGVPTTAGGLGLINGANIDTLGGKTVPSGSTLADTSSAQTFTGPKTLTSPVIANIAPGADFTLTQNSVSGFSSISTGAIANTLRLDTGTVLTGLSSKTSGALAYDNQQSPTVTTSIVNFNTRTAWTPSADTSNVAYGIYSGLYAQGSNNLTGAGSLRGFYSSVTNKGDGNVQEIDGYATHCGNQTTTNGKLVTSLNLFHAYAALATSTQPITNVFAVKIEDQGVTGVTNPWGIYQLGTTTKNRFDGITVMGQNVPNTGTTRLSIVSSDTAIGLNQSAQDITTIYNPSGADGSSNYSSLSVQMQKQGSSAVNGTGAQTGISVTSYNNGSGNMADLRGIDVITGNLSSATIANDTGIVVKSPFLGGAGSPITNQRGLWIKKQNGTGVTNAWGVYQADSGDQNFFNGKVGFGNSTPTYQADVTGDINTTGALRFSGTAGTSGQVPISNGAVQIWTTSAALAQAVMTANTTSTITFNNSGNSETIYNTSGTTIISATITLSTTSTPGQIERYVSAGAVTTVTTAGGTLDAGAAVTTLAANGSLAWQCDVNGHWIRLY